jgi:hypothetical protein
LGGCGLAVNCNTSHHRGAGRLNRIGGHSSRYVIRIVGHELCGLDGLNHTRFAGQAILRGRDSIATLETDLSLALIIQHELAHNLGVSGHCNSSTTRCVMNRNGGAQRLNSWCNSCRNQIRNHRA